MSITVDKIQGFTRLKTDNADKIGRNIGFEIYELTGDGTLKTVEVTTGIKEVKLLQHIYWSGDAADVQPINFGTDGIITSGAVTVVWDTAITNAKKVRIAIWGYN